ncbi:MAG: hypothetical protein D6725_12210 [Planctomycetota bacterium]|nr:MAG: hypothetical protein D6725_12210 [Planctomycetota bacterium]
MKSVRRESRPRGQPASAEKERRPRMWKQVRASRVRRRVPCGALAAAVAAELVQSIAVRTAESKQPIGAHRADRLLL